MMPEQGYVIAEAALREHLRVVRERSERVLDQISELFARWQREQNDNIAGRSA